MPRFRPSSSRPSSSRPASPRPVSPRPASLAVVLAGLIGALLSVTGTPAHADAQGFLETVKRHSVLTSTVPDNGDQNPYALFVAPVSSGAIKKDDVLITNFNNGGNLQGLGSTIVDYNPTTKGLSVFAKLPRNLPQCPGGIGLSTALVMLKSGWVIVGSAPSSDGTTATKGQGCLVILDNKGAVADTLAGPNIDAPWGNMAVIDEGAKATLFVSNAGFGIKAPTEDSPVLNQATVLRIGLTIADGKPPAVTSQTVIGSGFGAQADLGVFLIGPTGLALGRDGKTLFVSDATNNRITAIADAPTRTTSAGLGREISKDGFLRRPLAMTMAPNGHLLVANGLNGQVVEIDPEAGKQLYARWVDANKAQSPPGNGDLFGICMTPSGDGFYYVEDEVNALALAR